MNDNGPDNQQKQFERLKKENDQLRRQHRAVARELNQLQAIAHLVAGEPDGADLITKLGSHIAKLLDAKRVLIGKYINGVLIFEQAIEDHRVCPVELRVQAEEGVAGWVIDHKRPYVGSDDGPSAQGAAGEADKVLVVPILNHQRHLLGVIECHRPYYSLPFTQKEVELIQTIAVQVAPGLARALLFEQMERWTGSFENLLMFSASLNRKLEPDVLIRRLVEHAAGFLGADAGLAGLTTATDSVTNGYWQNGHWHTFQIHWPLQEEICTPGWVFINQCPYLTNDYPLDPLANQAMLTTFGVRNALCVPIMDAREAVLGFVELHNKAGGHEPFSWSDAHFLEALANSTAISLYNAHLLDALETQRARLQALAARNLTLLEDERQRIARELHDEAGQVLIGIKLELQVLAKKISSIAPELRDGVDQLRRQVNGATSQIKAISQALRPPILDELGLDVALSRVISDAQKRAGIPFYFDTDNLETRLPEPVETACYRIVQEALTNIIRHAQAAQAWLTLTADRHQVALSIQDDGCGFDTTDQLAQAGLGLLGMQERVIMLNGTFTIESTLGAGTIIRIMIPIVPTQVYSKPDQAEPLRF